jgi:ATP-dependent DNA helicase RecQ
VREKNDPKPRWSGGSAFPPFAPEPVDEMGPLQERIVAEAMAGKSVLGILPTGTGKSVCYQIPALSRFDKTGALTVVISPLVALMADQVQGLAAGGDFLGGHGERDAVAARAAGCAGKGADGRCGDAADLARTVAVTVDPHRAAAARGRALGAGRGALRLEMGARFPARLSLCQRGSSANSRAIARAPVLCLTATAKPEVVRDIRDHFQSRLGVDLMLLDGGAVRTNLSFAVLPTQKATKLTDILNAIEANLPPEGRSGAVVYCATREGDGKGGGVPEGQGLAADYFHAGLPPERKREVQEAFRTGELRVIAATNAFGMGIDKPDIRLVVHGDIPGSLGELPAGGGPRRTRPGAANCVLLFRPEDVERQFSLSARSRLARHEIGAILKACGGWMPG